MLSSKFGVEERGNADNPNQICRPPKGCVKVRVGDYGSGYVRTCDRPREKTFSEIVCVSRHFVHKPIYTITVLNLATNETRVLKTTNDHTCAVYNDWYWHVIEEEIENGFNGVAFRIYGHQDSIGFKDAKELAVGDYVPVLDVVTYNAMYRGGYDGYSCDGIGMVKSVEVDENKDGMWVYDLEVESDRHVYFANGVLVHNSQFINLAPITQTKCKENGLPTDTRFSELPKDVKQSVIDDAYHILDLVNANVETLINTNCFTSHGNVLHYALEYIAAEGFYFKKKHYIVHKIISDDIPCDKFKYSGISVKKAEIPASMKTFLKDIYESTMKQKWSESDYVKAVKDAYRKFVSLDWEEMSYYKKLRTPKAALSLTQSEKGAGAHARAANFYNGLLDELKIGGKYPVIGVGDEMRYSYILPTNGYGQDVLGFKGVFPDEFRKLFKPDYNSMFEKIFTKSLENYVKIMNYSTFDPTKTVEDDSFDIF